MLRQMLMADVVEVIVVWILGHPAVEVRPGENVLRTERSERERPQQQKRHTIASCLFSIVFTAISARK